MWGERGIILESDIEYKNYPNTGMGACGGAKRAENGVKDPSAVVPLKGIAVNPSLFVRELEGDFRTYYEVGTRLGGGRKGC